MTSSATNAPVTPGPETQRLRSTAASRAAVAITYAAAFTIPWNGMFVAGLLPGDAFLLLSLLLFAASDLGHRFPKLPGWAWTFGAIILIVTVLHEVLPTDAAYLGQRTVVDAAGQAIPEIQTNLGVGAKFLVPIIGMPMAFLFAKAHSNDALRRLMVAYAGGSAVSALLAFAQVVGASNLATTLTNVPYFSDGRSTGLAVHPNFLGTTCVVSLPIAMHLASRVGSRRLGIALGFAELLGIYASGSRGAAAVAALAVVVAVAVLPAYRRALPTVALLFGLIGAIAFVAKPSLGTAVLKAVRLTGDESSVSGSDLIRSRVAAQGIADFRHSPLDGVGMQVAAEAHNVYIQAVASGGLLLLAGFVVFTFGGLIRSARGMRLEPLARPLFVAALSGAVLASLENSLTDRLAYVPLALCALVPVVSATPRSEDQEQ